LLLKDIAQELGVNTIVEGSIIGAGDSLRILVQLIDVFPKERHIFAHEYHDGMHNVLTVQSSAVKDIAQKINVKLSKSEAQRLAKTRKVDPETYKAYLRGMYYLNQGTEESFEKGINCMQEAIDRDPGDALAYAGLAVGYAFVGHGQLNSEEAFLRATSAANKAIKLDPTIDEAYTALSILYLYDVWDWSVTRDAFENALANNPNNEVANAHFAWYHVLFGDMEKSIYYAKKAVMIEPFSASYSSWLALLYWYNKDDDNAAHWANRTLELKDDHPYGNLTLSWIYLRKKEYKQALEYIDKLPVDDDYWKMLRGYVYVKAGQPDKAVKYWNEMVERKKSESVNTCYMGIMAAYLGYTDKAFELLSDAVEKKYYPITYIEFYPGTENIQNDPRYNVLLQKMNLPTNKAFITSNQ
jgi:pentatricopeptide repeat protein